MLQIQPEKEIVIEFIKNEDYKYVRLLGAFYLRLVGKPVEIYTYLEPLYNDYRKVRSRTDLGFVWKHVDEYIDELLTSDFCCDCALPYLPKRHTLEFQGLLGPRISALSEELEMEIEQPPSDDEDKTKSQSSESRVSRDDHRREDRHREDRRDDRRDDHRRDDHRDRRDDRGRDDRRRDDRDSSRRRRSRSRSSERDHKRRRSRSRDRDSRRRPEESSGGQGQGKDEMSLDETNKLRVSLGLKPLK